MIRQFKERRQLVLKKLKNPYGENPRELLKDELEWIERIILVWEEALEKRQEKLFE